ncbi:hypothetical protein GLOTRDRAFT_113303 [Gloeophyllum trabeum ATCC 11539]|uniref:Sphingolipid long chain base-responsive protein LSP1 n=1 Tax=Gloeophyllum trabeum (strain ATCC 11539 / FP-39264 / Madison 617) TaxID=670483 RepID=S7S088_GLOTA|nr:uncharacterized protein GLOTRDRAFT_113303 [Gloeophyllum trabeum ATCC 11539]EPQ60760.1 hypothetical protein GLOTRDRAFT_113303 [Gloeophyllum trabeum ATCC 11539]
MSGFLSSIADRAQSAIQSSSLAQHIPGSYGRPTSPGAADHSAEGKTPRRSHALEAIQHQIRAFGQQYSSSTTPVQRIITAEKGVALDIDSLSRDAKGQSKELYMWGQKEDQDVKDVTDRLAYLNFVLGGLSDTLASKLDAARAPMKALRDAETSLTPRRNARASLENQISRIENDQPKGMEKKLSELRQQLAKAYQDDDPLEKEVELLKRKAIRESESQKWAALREYGEKLSLLAQASEGLIAALPSVPPTASQPYTGAQATGELRATLQHALDNYKPGQIDLYTYNSNPSNLRKSDTRSFGETHASELSSIHSADASGTTQPGIPLTPPAHDTHLPAHAVPSPDPSTTSLKSDVSVKSGSPGVGRTASPPQVQSPPLNPALLNQAPAPIPVPSSPPASNVSPAVPVDPINPSQKVPAITPTVAETGVPVSAGADGPGPASGSLKDLKSPASATSPPSGGLPTVAEVRTPLEMPAPTHGTPGAAPFESAEDEKKRLEREERERILREGGSGLSATRPGGFETAEEEKKRLEREERERLLRGQTGANAAPGTGHGASGSQDGEELPPYQDVDM